MQTGVGEGRTFTKSFRLGRDAECEVRLDSKLVSRVHARVVFEAGDWWIYDLDSTNGTFVDGRAIRKTKLSSESAVRFGENGPLITISLEDRPGSRPSRSVRHEVSRRDEERRDRHSYTERRDDEEAGWRIQSPEPARRSDEPRSEPSPQREPPPIWEPIDKEYQPRRVPEPLSPPAHEPVQGPQHPKDDRPEPTEPPRRHDRYRAQDFTLPLPTGWEPRTMYILTGPVTAGIQHNITVIVDNDADVETLDAYAEREIAGLETSLKRCRVLIQDRVKLDCGREAHRVIFTWYPENDQQVYQEQLYVLVGATGYKLTATFSKRTRKLLGKEVERVMLSFTPEE